MRISQSYIQKSKAGIHVAQALLIFIGGCLALAVLTKDGETGGQVGYYFGLVSIAPIRLSLTVTDFSTSVLSLNSRLSLPNHGANVDSCLALRERVRIRGN